ncbi:MAG: hypothetical protein LKE30_01785 [Bacteroidales bacterium]|jgi:hypothetical protein|nr:hypothetical protein [Bacteroidales bacterium]
MRTYKQRVDIGIGKKNLMFKDSIDQYIELRLAALGVPILKEADTSHDKFMGIVKDLLSNYRERELLASVNYCPSDQRIQKFLNDYFSSVTDVKDIVLPMRTFTLDSYGVARGLSLPKGEDKYVSEYVNSYRVKQGILNNPKNDRRTTKGVFHIAQGGLPIPDDKKAVPIKTAKYLFQKAFSESGDIMEIPYTSKFEENIKLYVSLLLRPIVCPEVDGIMKEKSMEIRFFAPGSLVSNLDFVESIFGNAGSPYHINNDPALDIEHFSGQTGCIVLAPQLTKLTKKECLLPPYEMATPRQRRDGMCYKDEKELYNDGQSFKLTIRDDKGFIATVIADNYFGYSKKEVKSMISYASNLFGNTEEEHAGGALIFPGYNQGDAYFSDVKKIKNTFDDVKVCGKEFITFFDEGYGQDKNYKNIYYLPENTDFNVPHQDISWKNVSGEHHLKLLPNNLYILPNGSKFRMEKYSGAANYRLVETVGDGLFCHKPCTVSGGGKSEISKSISDAIFGGSFFVSDFNEDFKKVEQIMNHDYSDRFKSIDKPIPFSRNFLSNRRSMGSVIKLLTPSNEFTDKYNAWLDSIPQYIKGIAFIVKRFYKEEWGNDWKSHFSVDILNGSLGNELKFENKKIYARYLRVGFAENGTWRTFKLRQDFVHADKVQVEDDITASIVVPTKNLSHLGKAKDNYSVKFVENCEYRLFQRPDDAVIRGYDKKAEQDLSTPNTFISNYEPLTQEDAKNMVEDVINFDKFTQPMRDMIKDVAQKGDCSYFVSSAHPRLVDGKPSKNVRYLQTRNDIVCPEERYVANVGIILSRKIKPEDKLYIPINSVLPGRRNNPKAEGIRPLAVYNPIHYQELPELFMDFICSLTGKSPSTTGAGSEGALTKGPFNALCTITDLNNALLSFILTGYDGFTTPAGYIGRKYRIDHDLSFLVPELWARLSNEERSPKFLIKNDYFEKLNDFTYKDQLVRASILGYRVTDKFVHHYFGRVFENPNVVFTNEMLKPEEQSMEDFVDGINNITENYTRVAQMYFNDGSVEAAIEPLKALLNIMVKGSYNGMTIESKEFRDMFTRDYVLESNWYKNRLKNKQNQDILLWEKHKQYLIDFLNIATSLQEDRKEHYKNKIKLADKTLDYLRKDDYYNSLVGTIGKDNLYK